MRSVAALIAVAAFALSHAAPLDLGGGGVYKGTEAQTYFARRFGEDFFTRLAAVMAKAGRGMDVQRSEGTLTQDQRKLPRKDLLPRSLFIIL